MFSGEESTHGVKWLLVVLSIGTLWNRSYTTVPGYESNAGG